MFKDMKNIMQESGKLMTEVSQFQSETLKSEKKVLGNAHELTKTLIEGKTHGHLQVPSRPPKSTTSETKTVQPSSTPSPEAEEKTSIDEKIKEFVRE